MSLEVSTEFGFNRHKTLHHSPVAILVLDKFAQTLSSQENYKQRHFITYIYIPAKILANSPGKTTAEFNSK